MQALRSRHASPGIEASRRAPIPSPPAEPPVLVLWLKQVTRRFCGEPPQTPREDSVMSRYPALTPIHDFILLFLPPCGHHSTALVTRSLKLSLLVSTVLGGIDLSRSLFTYTNANQTATCTCNTWPRVSPHHVVNHSSQRGATIHRSSDALVLSAVQQNCPATYGVIRWRFVVLWRPRRGSLARTRRRRQL
jgi:hypothetical protein